MKLSDRMNHPPTAILIVDDDTRRHWIVQDKVRPKPTAVFHAYNAQDGIRYLLANRRKLARVFLDFDLEPLLGPTGLDVARYMIDHNIRIPVTVISQNPLGSIAIVGELRLAGFKVDRHPIVIL